jgi:hypothetical protein
VDQYPITITNTRLDYLFKTPKFKGRKFTNNTFDEANIESKSSREDEVVFLKQF